MNVHWDIKLCIHYSAATLKIRVYQNSDLSRIFNIQLYMTGVFIKEFKQILAYMYYVRMRAGWSRVDELYFESIRKNKENCKGREIHKIHKLGKIGR